MFAPANGLERSGSPDGIVGALEDMLGTSAALHAWFFALFAVEAFLPFGEFFYGKSYQYMCCIYDYLQFYARVWLLPTLFGYIGQFISKY